jgi:hypothetical protein
VGFSGRVIFMEGGVSALFSHINHANPVMGRDVHIAGLSVDPWLPQLVIRGIFSQENAMGSTKNGFGKCHGLHGECLGLFRASHVKMPWAP